jgi:putative transposase
MHNKSRLQPLLFAVTSARLAVGGLFQQTRRQLARHQIECRKTIDLLLIIPCPDQRTMPLHAQGGAQRRYQWKMTCPLIMCPVDMLVYRILTGGTMKRKRFSEEQIIRILHEAETLDNIREVCRQHNIAEQTLYRWRRQFGCMDVAEAKRRRTLERENAALKRLVGELTLDNHILDFIGNSVYSVYAELQQVERQTP